MYSVTKVAWCRQFRVIFGPRTVYPDTHQTDVSSQIHVAEFLGWSRCNIVCDKSIKEKAVGVTRAVLMCDVLRND